MPVNGSVFVILRNWGGPLLDLVRHPFKCLCRWWQDAGFIKLWLKDLHYYQACDFFDGRRSVRPERLQRFAAGNGIQPAGREVTPSFDSNGMVIRR